MNHQRPMTERTRRLPHLGTIWLLLLTLFVAGPAFALEGGPPSAEAVGALHDGDHRVASRLLVSAESVKPGDTFRVGVAFKIDPQWYIYWQNPGDAGIPTDIVWEAEGVTFGALEWAAPSTFEAGEQTSYGYGDEVVLFSEATLAEDATEAFEIRAKVDYLACHNMCIPGHSNLSRTIQVGKETIPASEATRALMESSKERVPRRASDLGFETTFHYSVAPVDHATDVLLELIECEEAGEDCRELTLSYDALAHAFLTDGYSSLRVETVEVRDHPSAAHGWLIHMTAELLDTRPMSKPILSGVLRLQDAEGTVFPIHVRNEFEIASEENPAVAQAFPDWFVPKGSNVAEADAPKSEPADADAALEPLEDLSAPSDGEPKTPSLLWTILMAFLGGVILNLMPCVFPVLVLKVSSFATLAHENRKQVVSHGLAYTLGIVGSMLLLAAVVIGLRFTGTQVGWGFQFQQPYFLVALVVILVLFSLNLFGVFEITVSSQKLSESASAAHGTRRSIMEGVLAVVLATPCSAPFMGAAIGFALTGSVFTIIAVFMALGVGLAAPMVALTLMPGWAKLLPQPGHWMNHLKTFLGFALMGSGVWIVWLLGRQSGVDAMASTMMFSGLLAVAAWLYGLVQFQGWSKRKGVALSLAALAIAVGAYLSFPLPIEQAGRDEIVMRGDVEWHPWTEEGVQAALAEGRPVFVDFTADWCLTCKVNKKNAIDTAPTAAAIARYNVATFRADWTHENEDIRQKLEDFQRAGIPFYLVYSPDKPNEPRMLAEVITSKMLVDAFKLAAGEGR